MESLNPNTVAVEQSTATMPAASGSAAPAEAEATAITTAVVQGFGAIGDKPQPLRPTSAMKLPSAEAAELCKSIATSKTKIAVVAANSAAKSGLTLPAPPPGFESLLPKIKAAAAGAATLSGGSSYTLSSFSSGSSSSTDVALAVDNAATMSPDARTAPDATALLPGYGYVQSSPPPPPPKLPALSPSPTELMQSLQRLERQQLELQQQLPRLYERGKTPTSAVDLTIDTGIQLASSGQLTLLLPPSSSASSTNYSPLLIDPPVIRASDPADRKPLKASAADSSPMGNQSTFTAKQLDMLLRNIDFGRWIMQQPTDGFTSPSPPLQQQIDETSDDGMLPGTDAEYFHNLVSLVHGGNSNPETASSLPPIVKPTPLRAASDKPFLTNANANPVEIAPAPPASPLIVQPSLLFADLDNSAPQPLNILVDRTFRFDNTVPVHMASSQPSRVPSPQYLADASSGWQVATQMAEALLATDRTQSHSDARLRARPNYEQHGTSNMERSFGVQRSQMRRRTTGRTVRMPMDTAEKLSSELTRAHQMTLAERLGQSAAATATAPTPTKRSRSPRDDQFYGLSLFGLDARFNGVDATSASVKRAATAAWVRSLVDNDDVNRRAEEKATAARNQILRERINLAPPLETCSDQPSTWWQPIEQTLGCTSSSFSNGGAGSCQQGPFGTEMECYYTTNNSTYSSQWDLRNVCSPAMLPLSTFCEMCKEFGEPAAIYMSHRMHINGVPVCPKLSNSLNYNGFHTVAVPIQSYLNYTVHSQVHTLNMNC